MYRTGVRRLLFQVTRHEGDVSKAGGSLSRRERAAENLWIEEEVNDFSFSFSFLSTILSHFLSFLSLFEPKGKGQERGPEERGPEAGKE